MNSQTTTVFLALIRSAVCGDEITESERILYSKNMLEELKSVAKAHDVSNILAIGLKNNQLVPPESEKENEAEILKAIYRYEQLSFELEKLSAAFEKAKISFIPLKGSVLRRYYPEPWMRTSCDVDVLVHKEDIEKSVSVLENICGYKFEEKTPHDISMFSPTGKHIELHFDLVEEEVSAHISDMLKIVWIGANVCRGYAYRYEMSDEMFYFYHIVHMYVHYKYRGTCGIRPFVDMCVIEKHMSYDNEKLLSMLEKAGIINFFQMISKLKNVWFEGGKHTEETLLMEKQVLSESLYGSQDSRDRINASKESGGKLKSFLKLMILPRENLEIVYPSLKKRPYLFPLYQVRRWCRFFVPSKRKKIMHLTSVRNSVTKEERDLTKKMFDDLKLDNYKKWD